MSRVLLVLRHAKADRDAAVDDFARPLTRRGLSDAPRVGQQIKEQGLIPDLILSSPAERARATALAVVQAWGAADEAVTFDDRLYLADRDALLGVLRQVPAKAGTVLLVGHNPGLEELVEYLAAEPAPRTKKGKLLTTAALAELETRRTWRTLGQGQARLRRLLRPRDLDD